MLSIQQEKILTKLNWTSNLTSENGFMNYLILNLQYYHMVLECNTQNVYKSLNGEI